MANILVCDDERSICEMLDIALRRDGHKVETVNSGEAAKRKIDGALYDLIISDIKMPNIDGIEVLRHAHSTSPESAVILITAVDDYEAAVQAVKAGGASDYIRKNPGLVDEIKLAIRRTLEKASLSKQNFALRRDAASRNSLDNIIGGSPAMQKLKQTIRTVASTGSTILIYGESGTGKELVARAIHKNSLRKDKPFVALNCAALTETLLESELFGHEKGSFTSAICQKKGLLEVAEDGSVFLDEVGELPLTLQAKLLRVLQEREFVRVGGTRSLKLNVRFLAATNKDLQKAVREEKFRADLYHRLNVISLTLPPLREHPEDIALLAEHFAARYAKKCNHHVKGFSPEARACLMQYDWPGNIRELENATERAVVIGSSDYILPEDLPETLLETAPTSASASTSYHDAIRNLKKQMILNAFEQSGGNITETARVLGVHSNYLHRLIRNLDLRLALKKSSKS